ncbi:hypothetical protein CKM354_000169300 [Cercospora kikuchii]|uniref:Arylamine N-acetyltransferase n=1 Tax=Cercospora kikuchii TaxID=84275 RepID=A0A9P3CBF0_9PEZI|nr:uncharacterized protein CKM354_000169300 [Cercospora kikuchii]GIZ38272.1 hypothetical protein CKM354_000169300 [Cercospora kikuchii]
MAAPSVFSEDQIAQYLSYINLPPSLRQQRFSGNAAADLYLLRQLHIHAISSIPYENLSLHYNPTHTITIDPQLTYEKTVTNGRGRGGYCMENSIFHNHILRALGFPAYLAAVRIRYRVDGIPQGNYSGWVHLVNLVTLSDGTKWSVDVGFGGDGATAPIQLVHDKPQVNLGSQEIRLFHDHIPTQIHRTEETKQWIYQYRNGPEQEWNAFYAFSETEATEADFHNINWYTGSHPESFQTFTCIIVSFMRRPKDGNEEEQEIYGKRMLVNGVIKENLGSKTEIVQECTTEAERLAALQKWFRMSFTKDEAEAIRGWCTELRGDEQDSSERLEVWHAKRGKAGKLLYQKV